MYLNIFLILIIISNILFSLKGFNDISFFRKFEFHIGSIRSGEKFRFLSSAFLHADYIHLALNMYVLYSFAPVVIEYFGSISFLIVYFCSLFSGGLLTYYFHKNDYNYRAIGASGAVMGIVYSAILINPNGEIALYGFIKMPSYVFGILYLLYSIYGMKAKNDNIGHTAHFGGAIGGYAFTLLKQPEIIFNNTLVIILVGIPILVLFFMARKDKF